MGIEARGHTTSYRHAGTPFANDIIMAVNGLRPSWASIQNLTMDAMLGSDKTTLNKKSKRALQLMFKAENTSGFFQILQSPWKQLKITESGMTLHSSTEVIIRDFTKAEKASVIALTCYNYIIQCCSCYCS